MKHWLETIVKAHDTLRNLESLYTTDVTSDLERVISEMTEWQKWLLPNWHHLEKPIMCLDFDGVVSEYKHGWRGPGKIDDELPVTGAIRFIEDAVEHFTVLIFSSRCNHKDGIAAIEKWLCDNRLSETARKQLIYQPGKPSAFTIIDDRAIQFVGVHRPPKHIRDTFRPYYYEIPGWRAAQNMSKRPDECVHGIPWDDCPDCRH